MTQYPNIPLSSIIIDDRLRVEYGDLTDLDNIASVGLIEPIILQHKFHIDPNGDYHAYHLVAGGRRLRKLSMLGFTELEHGVTSTPGKAGYLFRSELDPDVAKEIELYENIARKQMTWKERVLSIEQIHLLKLKRAAQGETFVSWTAEMTGKELGVSKAHSEYIIRIARALRDPKSPVHNAANMMDAVKLLASEKLDAMKRRSIELAAKSSIIIMPDGGSKETTEANAILAESARPAPRIVPLSSMLFNGKMEDILATFASESIDGIYTDWPYAIDMDNIQQQNMGMDVSSTAAEHKVEDNLNMFPIWLASMKRVLKPNSFCVIWCDISNWHIISSDASRLSFRVQRWPFHWVKTGPCQNGSAQYNQTKSVEHAMVLRMPGATLAKQIPNNYWIGTFDPGEKAISDHPFAKPRKLHERVLSDFFPVGSTVLDPFAGTMGISLACLSNGYHPMAVELVENHFVKGEFAIKEKYRQLTINNVQFT